MDLTVEPDAVVVVAGIPGAGKTTLIDRVVDPGHAVIVDVERRRRTGRVPRSKPVRIAGHYRRIVGAVLLRTDAFVVVHTRGTSVLGRRLVSALARVRKRPAHLVLLVAPAQEAVDGQKTRGRTIRAGEMGSYVRRFAGVVADHESIEHREGWTSVTVLDREAATAVRMLGPVRVGAERVPVVRASPSPPDPSRPG